MSIFAYIHIHEAPEELITWIRMNNLNNDDVRKLSQVFDNTSATYKFFWLLGLLDVVNCGRAHQPITFNEMVARMLGKAWNALTISHFSFGKCDALLENIFLLVRKTPLNYVSLEERVVCYMLKNPNDSLVKDIVKRLTHNVPYRFLYPWIGFCSNPQAVVLSNEEERRCIYSIEKDRIKINPIWIRYLQAHSHILEGFAIHNLNCFLAKRNPNFILPIENNISKTADGLTLHNRYFMYDAIQWMNHAFMVAEDNGLFVQNRNYFYKESTYVENQFVNKK